MKTIVVESKSIARRTIANEREIRISWCEEWRWIISKRSWLAQQQVFIFALKIFGNICVCHQCRKVSNKDEIKMGQSDWGRKGCEENLIGFCSCTSRKMICFWQLCRSCQQNASLSKINVGGGVWRQSLVKYWTRMSYICKFSAQWMISALLSHQNVDGNFFKNKSSLSLLLDVICMRMRAVWWFHSLVEGLHGVSRLLSKSSSCQSVYPPISDKLTTHSIFIVWYHMSDISRGKCFSSNRESIRVVADSKSDQKNIQHMIKTKKADILLVVLVVNVLEHLQVSTDIRSNDVELMVKYIESKRPLS